MKNQQEPAPVQGEQIHNTVRQIKRSFHSLMNGVASQSMRNKGLDYKVNWGVSVPHLKEMAAEYEKNYSLAVELWKEDIRECKIMATLLMPASEMPVEVVDIWMEQTHSQEIAELAVFHLYQYLEAAPIFAYRWMASEHPLYQLSGFLLIGCLFRQGKEPDERGINEYLDQLQLALSEGSLMVRHAALNSLNRFCELGDSYLYIAHKAQPDYV